MSTTKYVLKKYNLTYDGKVDKPINIPNVGRNNLAELVHELNFKVGAEVGVAAGEYSEVLCRTNPQMKIYGVDPWKAYKGYSDYTRSSTFKSLYGDAIRRLSPFANYVFITEFSKNALSRFQDSSLDFVYIDANHKEPYISDDISTWWEKLKQGGILAGHDYTLPDVANAVNRFTIRRKINQWFILGSMAKEPGTTRDESLSWMIIK